MKLEELIKSSNIDDDEKLYWLNILPVLSDFRRKRLKDVLEKKKHKELKKLNKNLLINFEENENI
jgi:hypothetical protein